LSRKQSVRHLAACKTFLTQAHMAYLGCHECKRINAGVEVADRNADGKQRETCGVDTK